jgi:uncharacterized membrane protein SpoIIM required for sporulation
MDTRTFVERSRPSWERLELLLARVEGRGLPSLDVEELRELGVLHRRATADLAAARTYHADSRIAGYLNQLALRSHNVVYRAPARDVRPALRRFVRSIPTTVRRRRGVLAASVLIFFVGVLVGAVGTAIDENVADLLVGREITEGVREGRYWIDNVREALPKGALAGFVLTNNLWVSLNIFAFGFTGVLAAHGLFVNGAMLGSVLVLCGHYGFLPRLIAFVGGHGVIELSAVMLAGAGGFCMFDGWLHPGDRSRLAGLRRGAQDGLRFAAAAVVGLLAAGPVEGLISTTDEIPAALRIGLGIALGAALWSWLLLSRDVDAGADDAEGDEEGQSRPSDLIST